MSVKVFIESLESFDFSQLEAQRIFHGRGQCFPGLAFINADWYQPVLMISAYQALPDTMLQALQACIESLPGSVETVLLQRRYEPGGPMDCLRGDLPDQSTALEQGLRYELALGAKQNIGYFMDMAPGRYWLRERLRERSRQHSRQGRVLNLFAYTCAFSVAAIAAGAGQVVNVDMSRAALTQGRRNHQLNDQQAALEKSVRFMAHDIFRSWGKIRKHGPYDIVIIDPPSRQKGSFTAERDYGRVVSRLPELMPEGGDVLACLNAPHLDEHFLHELFVQKCPVAQFKSRLLNRRDFPERDPEKTLKMLHYQLPR